MDAIITINSVTRSPICLLAQALRNIDITDDNDVCVSVVYKQMTLLCGIIVSVN